MRTSEANWNRVKRWNALAAEEQRLGLLTTKSEWRGPVGFWPVFCASLADVFDNEVPHAWRRDLVGLIDMTPHLSWQLLTKRIGNVPRFVPDEWVKNAVPPNVRLMVSVANQEEADRDIPKLLALRCKNGVSYEPALGPIDWGEQLRWLEWIIIGGESKQGAGKPRIFPLEWPRSTISQCRSAHVPVFVKQLGSRWGVRDRAGADPAEWPEDLRIQEFPSVHLTPNK